MNRRRYLALLGAGMATLAGCSSNDGDGQSPVLDKPRGLRLWNRDETAHTLDIKVLQTEPPPSGKGDPGEATLYDDQVELQPVSKTTISDVIKRPKSVNTHIRMDATTVGRRQAAFILPVHQAISDLVLAVTDTTDVENYVTRKRSRTPLSRSLSPSTNTTTTATTHAECTDKPATYDGERKGRVTFAVEMENATDVPREGVLRIYHQSCRCQGTDPECSSCRTIGFQGAYKLAPDEVTTRAITRGLTREIDRYQIRFDVLKKNYNSMLGAEGYAAREGLLGLEKGAKNRVNESAYTEGGGLATDQKDFYVCHGSTHDISATIRPSDQDGTTITVDLST